MGIDVTTYNDSATISTTEYSAPNDAAYAAGSVKTTDAVVQAFFDVSAMAAGDEFRFRAYESVNAGDTPAVVAEVHLAGAQSGPLVFPAMLLAIGWDFTITKIAGTDRSIGWSIGMVTP